DLIIGEINRLSSTVSQLLAFSRSGRQAVAGGASVRLRDMISSALAVLRAESEGRGVEIDVTGESDCSLTGQQAEALREIMINLVLNAIQASPDRGRVSIGIKVDGESGAHRRDAENADKTQRREGPGSTDGQTARPLVGLLELSITDEGPGISAEDQSKVLEPFYTTKPRGTGLGLSIVQRRINELKGRLDIVSPASGGRGTRVT